MNTMTRDAAYAIFLRTGRNWYRTEAGARDYALAMIMQWDIDAKAVR